MNKKLYKRRRKFVGDLLHIERKYLGYRQEDFAQMLGVRQELISKIEFGTRRLDVIELIDYCEKLNLSLTDFAAKIESRLFAEGLMQRPRRRIRNESNKKVRIKVEVSWCLNNFTALLRDRMPFTIVLMESSFVELQRQLAVSLDSRIDNMVADGAEEPQWLIRKDYELEYKFTDAASLLKAYGPYLSLAAISRVTGINQNLLSQYANGQKNARPYQMKRILDGIRKIGKDLMAAGV